MPDYLNWYLVELRLRLASHFKIAQLENILREVESHLNLSKQKLQSELNLDDSASTCAAIEAFGDPEKVALSYLRESPRNVFGMPAKNVAVLSAMLVLACWAFHWMSLHTPFDNYGATWQNGLAGVLGCTSLFLFIYACRAGRGSFLKPILKSYLVCALITCLGMSVLTIGTSPGGNAIPRFALTETKQQIRERIKRLDFLVDYLKKGEQIYENAHGVKGLPLIYRNPWSAVEYLQVYNSVSSDGRDPSGLFPVPNRWFNAPLNGQIFALDRKGSFEEAKAAWKLGAYSELYSIDICRNSYLQLDKKIDQANAGRIFFFDPMLCMLPIWCSLYFLPVLLLIDAGFLALLKRKRAMPQKVFAT